MKHSDAPIAVNPNPNDTEMNEWEIVEDSGRKGEDPSAASAAPWLAARLVSVFYYCRKRLGWRKRGRWKLLHDGVSWPRDLGILDDMLSVEADGEGEAGAQSSSTRRLARSSRRRCSWGFGVNCGFST